MVECAIEFAKAVSAPKAQEIGPKAAAFASPFTSGFGRRGFGLSYQNHIQYQPRRGIALAPSEDEWEAEAADELDEYECEEGGDL